MVNEPSVFEPLKFYCISKALAGPRSAIGRAPDSFFFFFFLTHFFFFFFFDSFFFFFFFLGNYSTLMNIYPSAASVILNNRDQQNRLLSQMVLNLCLTV